MNKTALKSYGLSFCYGSVPGCERFSGSSRKRPPSRCPSKTFLHKNSSRLLNKYHLVIYKLKTSIASAAVICICHSVLLIRHAIIKGVAFNCQKGSSNMNKQKRINQASLRNRIVIKKNFSRKLLCNSYYVHLKRVHCLIVEVIINIFNIFRGVSLARLQSILKYTRYFIHNHKRV